MICISDNYDVIITTMITTRVWVGVYYVQLLCCYYYRQASLCLEIIESYGCLLPYSMLVFPQGYIYTHIYIDHIVGRRFCANYFVGSC